MRVCANEHDRIILGPLKNIYVSIENTTNANTFFLFSLVARSVVVAADVLCFGCNFSVEVDFFCIMLFVSLACVYNVYVLHSTRTCNWCIKILAWIHFSFNATIMNKMVLVN